MALLTACIVAGVVVASVIPATAQSADLVARGHD